MSNNINDLIRKVVEVEMNKVLQKMEEVIKNDFEVFHGETNKTKGLRAMYAEVKQFLSEQPKEPLTKGDVIRESNERLANYMSKRIKCSNCDLGSDCRYDITKVECKQNFIDYLNQKAD